MSLNRHFRMLNFTIYTSDDPLVSIRNKGEMLAYGRVHFPVPTPHIAIKQAAIDGASMNSTQFKSTFDEWEDSTARGFKKSPNMSLEELAPILLKISIVGVKIAFFSGYNRWEYSAGISSPKLLKEPVCVFAN